MTKEEWLEEEIFVDVYGREYNLSDVTLELVNATYIWIANY